MDISAEKLKQIRLERGLSQDLLARQSGLSLRTIQRLEQAGGGSAESLLALSATLNVSPQAIRHSSGVSITPWSFKQRSVQLSALLLMLALLLLTIGQASQGRFSIYLDLVSLIFLLLFVLGVTLLAAGPAALLSGILNLSLLWRQVTGTLAERRFLRQLYQLQYRLCYSGALLISLLGLVSVLYFGPQLAPGSMQRAFGVLCLAWLYAAGAAELILRPVLFKLKVSMQSEQLSFE